MPDDATRRPPITTTDSGIPAPSDEFSLTVGPGGPTVLHDHYVVQKIQHFNRERVPERVVHAKGSGAHGFFEVTEDVSQFTKADLFQPGRKTPLFLRFSTVAGELGSPDTVRDPRGFAVKFYTEQGNYDLVGNNTPVFFVRDASKFQDFIHSQKRLPDTGMRSNDMQWDFWTLSPESAHQVTILMSDRGTPRTYRNMNGYQQPHLLVGQRRRAAASGSSTTSRPSRGSRTSPTRRRPRWSPRILTTTGATCARRSIRATRPSGASRSR